jgi:hypothetical protein
MGTLYRLQGQLLADGRITDDELQVVVEYMESNGRLDLDDVRLLVNLRSEAREVCPEFEALLFATLREVILRDGRVGPDEQYYLLKMLCGDERFRQQGQQFLAELRAELTDVTPEFESLYQQAFAEA